MTTLDLVFSFFLFFSFFSCLCMELGKAVGVGVCINEKCNRNAGRVWCDSAFFFCFVLFYFLFLVKRVLVWECG